jgi:hypothetical protein
MQQPAPTAVTPGTAPISSSTLAVRSFIPSGVSNRVPVTDMRIVSK